MTKTINTESGSPFVPRVTLNSFVAVSIHLIEKEKYEPAPAIATAITDIMDMHSKLRLYPFILSLSEYGTTEENLKMLNLGFRYPLDSILASAVCKQSPKEKRSETFDTLLVPSMDPLRRFVQKAMKGDLNATINLINMDPSGALVFEFLKKYPCSQDDYFLLGMDIATTLFFGLSVAVAEFLPGNHWLTVWQGVSQT